MAEIIDDSATHGETYDLEIEGKDENGDVITLDDTYSAVYRVMTGYDGNVVAAVLPSALFEVAAGVMTFSEGKARANIDTNATGFAPGLFWLDVRFTDPDGNDYWSQPIRLTLYKRYSQPS